MSIKKKFVSMTTENGCQYAMTEDGLVYVRFPTHGVFNSGLSNWQFDSYIDEENIKDTERRD